MKLSSFTSKATMILLAGVLAFGSAAGASGAGVTTGQTSNIVKAKTGNWAERALNRWTEAGILKGYPDGSLNPDQPISRAEFAAIVNRLFGMPEKPNATIGDATSAWATAELSKAYSAGYMTLGKDAKAEPGKAMTRAETALALSKVFKLPSPAAGMEQAWPDLNGLDGETVSAIQALTSGGYLKGLPDGTFGPAVTMTRAQLAVLADRLIALLVDKAGTIEPGSVNGNVVVNKAGAVLKDATVSGQLYLAQGIGEGDATLDHSTVKGKTIVSGGGAHSINVKDSSLSETDMAKVDGQVRIHATGKSTIGTVRFLNGGTLEADVTAAAGIDKVLIEAGTGSVTLSGDFDHVVASPLDEAEIILVITGHVAQLTINGRTRIQLAEGAVVDMLHIAKDASGSVIEGAGKVGKIEDLSGSLINRQTIGGGTGTPSTPTTPTNPAGDNWHLVWTDDFTSGAIDRTKWTFDTTNGSSVGNPGWGNNELEYYTDRTDNAKTDGGNLVITAKKEQYEGFGYTSARLKTKGLFSQTFGKFEIRAKMPTGKGFWPAIWMLPETTEYGTWASSGEIDIMEGWGSNPSKVGGTIHYGEQWPGNVYSTQDYVLPNNGTTADFHTYTLEWEPNEMRWYVDGHLYSTKNDWFSKGAGQHDNYAYPAPFDQPFHLLINLAVGGNFDGNPTEETLFPNDMKVDYVRVYAKDAADYAPVTPKVIQPESYPAGSNLPQAPDNDLVYNAGFTQNVTGDSGMGIPNTAHWVVFKENGSTANIAIEDIGGTNYAHVAIGNAGGNFYSIQPQAIVSLAKGHYYKLTFDAKTDTNRNMTVRLTGGESRGFAAYSQALNASLGSGFQSYELSFQMKENSDPAARIEFNMGTNAHPVWFGKAKLVEIAGIPFDHDSPKTPQGNGNHVYNGAFDQGEPNRLSYWHLNVTGGASATASVPAYPASERKLNVAIASGGSAAGDVRIVQKGINLIESQDYKLTFDASASSVRSVQVGLFGHDGTPIAVQDVALTTTESPVTATFNDIVGASDDEGQLIFSIGGAAGSLKIDNVKLLRTSVHFDPDIVFYPLINGNFEDGLTGWETSGNDDQAGAAGAGAIGATFEDGAAKLTIGNQGGRPWNALLFQSGIPAKSNIEYELSFKARSTVNRPMEVVVENGSPRHLDRTVDLTATDQTFTFDFTPSKSENVGLKFLVGLIHDSDTHLASHDIYLSDIKLKVKDSPYAEPPTLRKDLSNNKVGQPIEIAFTNDPDWYGAITSVSINGTALTASEYDLSAGVLTLHASNFAAAANYNVLVRATGYADTSVAQPVYSNDGNLVVNGDFASGTGNWETWSGEGGAASLTAADGVGTVAIDARGGQTWANQLFQSGIPMTAGKSYELSFKAYASVARPITVEFTNTSGGAETFVLTTANATYTKTFTVATASPLKLNFLIGNVTSGASSTPTNAHTLYLDDITVKEVDTPPPTPKGLE